ncbi:MAG TPA: hypothetical protein VFC37_22330 [Terracidiphilus sp.]|nr:hypothetical protein [Terracidiphilus sp.]
MKIELTTSELDCVLSGLEAVQDGSAKYRDLLTRLANRAEEAGVGPELPDETELTPEPELSPEQIAQIAAKHVDAEDTDEHICEKPGCRNMASNCVSWYGQVACWMCVEHGGLNLTDSHELRQRPAKFALVDEELTPGQQAVEDEGAQLRKQAEQDKAEDQRQDLEEEKADTNWPLGDDDARDASRRRGDGDDEAERQHKEEEAENG